tara:strand:- start:3620 stop:3997 length:378 start_codon:yes stop_codon:yes gene_type:complete
MALTTAPGSNSTFKVNDVLYSATSSMETSAEITRIETTGFGNTGKAFVPGITETPEATVRIFGGTGLALGTQTTTCELAFASGFKISSTSGNWHVMSISVSADIESAVEHEYTISFTTYTLVAAP